MIHEPESKKIPISEDSLKSLLHPMSLALTGFLCGFTLARGQGRLLLTHLMQLVSDLIHMLLTALYQSIKTQTVSLMSPFQSTDVHPHTKQH